MTKAFCGPSGLPRVRYWPLVGIGAYLAYNGIVLAMIMGGSRGILHPVLHAPITWLFR